MLHDPPGAGLARPQRLKPGSAVAVVAPSSGVLEPSRLQRGLAVLARLGLRTTVFPGTRELRGFLAGSDRQRADELLDALADDSFDAVWVMRGGYGALRTVAAFGEDAARRLAAARPKILIGFSDTTVIHAFLARLGWVSFYGPSVVSLGEASAYTLAHLRSALFEAEPYEVAAHPDDPWVSTLVPGSAQGPLAGGCLSLLAATVGTELQVDFDGKICFFEDVGETPARIDRMLSQLLAAGCFAGCRAILIGEHVGGAPSGGSSLGFEQVFADLLAPLGAPCCFYLPVGHGKHLATLPLGVQAALDADRGLLQILEPAVQ